MPSEISPPDASKILEDFRGRVRIGPVPDWVAACPFDAGFRAKEPGTTTQLLVNEQIHAEQHQLHFHAAIRLETMEAVTKWSQWKFEFEPVTQSVVLHWIKVRRGEQEFNHLDLGKMRFLQRE